MCESCQRPASNGIIVPRDSGPLTTSALEKSQKQTAQCKQEQPGAAVQGQSSQVRGPAAEAASAAPGRDQAARRPQHDPPRRSGTVGAARSLPVLHGLGSPVQAAVLSVEKSCKGPPDSPESGPRSAAFPCTQLEQFPGAQDAELNSFQGMLGFANLYLPPPPPPPPDNEPVELVEGVGVGGVESRTHAKWELVGAQPVTGCCELCPRGAARQLGVLFITCWTRAPQEGCGFLKPSVSLIFSGIQRK